MEPEKPKEEPTKPKVNKNVHQAYDLDDKPFEIGKFFIVIYALITITIFERFIWHIEPFIIY